MASDFPDLAAESNRRRQLGQRLSEQRRASGLSQTIVAARMGTAASVVSKLERGGDVKLSTLQRYCAAVGAALSFALAPTRRKASRARKRGGSR
jgi:transcriptional regulator with XRE-family HTH domain